MGATRARSPPRALREGGAGGCEEIVRSRPRRRRPAPRLRTRPTPAGGPPCNAASHWLRRPRTSSARPARRPLLDGHLLPPAPYQRPLVGPLARQPPTPSNSVSYWSHLAPAPPAHVITQQPLLVMRLIPPAPLSYAHWSGYTSVTFRVVRLAERRLAMQRVVRLVEGLRSRPTRCNAAYHWRQCDL